MIRKRIYLDIKTYQKPTEIFQHTHFTSCHPPSAKNGFIKGEAIRHYLDSKPALKSGATLSILSREHHLRSIFLKDSRHLNKKPKPARKSDHLSQHITQWCQVCLRAKWPNTPAPIPGFRSMKQLGGCLHDTGTSFILVRVVNFIPCLHGRLIPSPSITGRHLDEYLEIQHMRQ